MTLLQKPFLNTKDTKVAKRLFLNSLAETLKVSFANENDN
jgi:hypothetical protein